MSKLPAFQFYPADWRKDLAVQSLDYHDRGIWFEMLCLMHESSERGKLLLNGQKLSEDALARLLGLDKQILTSTLTTLITSGVAKVEQTTGVIYCKRMVDDEKLRQIRSDAGKQGGNPRLLKQNPTTPVKQNPTPSSSSSSSSSDNTEDDFENGTPDPIPDRTDTINSFLDSIANVMGAKSRHGLTRKSEWMTVIKICIAEKYSLERLMRTLTGILSAPKFEIKYFKPEKVIDELRLPTNGHGSNGNGKAPQWQIDRDACGVCDERGYVLVGDKHEVCKHK